MSPNRRPAGSDYDVDSERPTALYYALGVLVFGALAVVFVVFWIMYNIRQFSCYATVNSNRAPPWSLSSILIRQPWASTMRSTTASPIPVPSASVL